MQAEHARRATQFAYQGHTSACRSAAASVLLGEIYGSMGNHGAALSAFTTAMTVLTQHGLRTRQGGAVMRHIGRCFLQQQEFRRARSHLNEVRSGPADIPAAPYMHAHGSDGPHMRFLCTLRRCGRSRIWAGLLPAGSAFLGWIGPRSGSNMQYSRRTSEHTCKHA